MAGGGIAGTVAALALHDAGFTPVIQEARDHEADERGAFVTVAVNGIAALRTLGLDPGEVFAAGFPTPAPALRNAGGRHLARLPLGGPEPDGTVTTTIRRADLCVAPRAAAWPPAPTSRRRWPTTSTCAVTGSRRSSPTASAAAAPGPRDRSARSSGTR